MGWADAGILLLILATVAVAGWVVGRAVDCIWEWIWRRGSRSGGFEVKPNTGDRPVLREKEDEHG